MIEILQKHLLFIKNHNLSVHKYYCNSKILDKYIWRSYFLIDITIFIILILHIFIDMQHFIYGPFLSSRLGLSLGIDLLAQNKYKVCTFDCIYCEIGRTNPKGYSSVNKRISIAKFHKTIKEKLTRILKIEQNLDSITIGYNGEPTLISDLAEIIDLIKHVRDYLGIKTPISIFTNSSTILDDQICNKLAKTDKIIAKLDVATQRDFILINNPHFSVPHISKIIAGLKNYKDKYPNNKLIIQTMLIDGTINNLNDENLKNLSKAYDLICPDLVQLYSVARPPPSPSIKKVKINKIVQIKNKINNFSQKEKKINIKIFQ